MQTGIQKVIQFRKAGSTNSSNLATPLTESVTPVALSSMNNYPNRDVLTYGESTKQRDSEERSKDTAPSRSEDGSVSDAFTKYAQFAEPSRVEQSHPMMQLEIRCNKLERENALLVAQVEEMKSVNQELLYACQKLSMAGKAS